METPDIEVINRAINMARIELVKDNPSTIALIDLKKAAGCTDLSDHCAIVLGAAAVYQPVARRHSDVIKHGGGKAVAAVLPVVTAILAHVEAAVVGIVNETGNFQRHQKRVMI